MPADINDIYDLIVVGAGGSGLAAALFGAIAGLRVLVIEKTEFIGGTTALSVGTAWIPNTHLAAAIGADDSIEKAATYLRNAVGNQGAEAMRMAFLRNGPAAIQLLEKESEVRFRALPYHPDYESDLEGATVAGRALEPLPLDVRLLDRYALLIRPPIPELTALRGKLEDHESDAHPKAKRARMSFMQSMRLFARNTKDRIQRKPTAPLIMGNALIGRLLYSLRRRKVPIWANSEIYEFVIDHGRVIGISVDRRGKRYEVYARRGVILASGGFNGNPRLRAQLVAAAVIHSPMSPGNTGKAIEAALHAGATLGKPSHESVLWAPVSVCTRKDGTRAVFPHFMLDRGKPGTLVVNQAGKRFLNETLSYHRFGQAMVDANRTAPSIPAFLIADRRALKAYGLGMVRPGGRGLKRFIKEGYLVEAPTIDALAQKLEIDATELQATVERMKQFAQTGVDSDFGRGSTLYQRNLGDPKRKPNPTLGAIAKPPFYAVRLYPGDIGAAAGLITDEHARVLGANGTPITGLYAIGNDMNSIMGGTYPAPGITLGPGIVFAYIAVTHAAKGQTVATGESAEVAQG
jgi:succinate dehydrogenase/fumarate reductase flavoprotein subunit